MTLNDAIDSFLAHLRRRGCSPRTIDAYLFDLGKFSAFVSGKYGLAEKDIAVDTLDTSIIRAWADSCLSANNTPRTLARKMATLKSFFKFLVFEGIIDNNPTDRVLFPKIKKKPPNALSQDEIRQIIAAPSDDERYFLRNRAILLLLYSSGMRLSELVSLRMENVLLERQLLRITGKGNKERLLPLSDQTRSAILDYFLSLEKENLSFVNPKKPAFQSSGGNPMTPRMIQYMVKNYGLKAGIPLHVHPHLIRHSIATHLIEEGCSVESVRQTLGHEDLATTSIYIKASTKFLLEEHKKYNPTDKIIK